MTDRQRHIEARDLRYTWVQDGDDVQQLVAEHADHERTIQALRDRQRTLSEQASESRLARQKVINERVRATLPILAERLVAALRIHGPGWEGVLNEDVVRIEVDDMHNIAAKNGTPWCGWSVPWARPADGLREDRSDEYPLTAEDVKAAMEAVGIKVDTWRSDVGVSCRFLTPVKFRPSTGTVGDSITATGGSHD